MLGESSKCPNPLFPSAPYIPVRRSLRYASAGSVYTNRRARLKPLGTPTRETYYSIKRELLQYTHSLTCVRARTHPHAHTRKDARH